MTIVVECPHCESRYNLQPDLLQNLGGMLSNPMAKMAMAGVAAYAAQRIMGGGPGSGGMFGGGRDRIL